MADDTVINTDAWISALDSAFSYARRPPPGFIQIEEIMELTKLGRTAARNRLVKMKKDGLVTTVWAAAQGTNGVKYTTYYKLLTGVNLAPHQAGPKPRSETSPTVLPSLHRANSRKTARSKKR